MSLRLIKYKKKDQLESLMNQLAIERLQQKSVRESLVERLCTDFNLAPLVARTLSVEMDDYFAHCYQHQAAAGQLTYLAVSQDSPAGRPLTKCERIPIRLTMYTADDLVAIKNGIAALRQQRIQRMTEEAYEQGALLTHEDLGCLLSSSLATIKRDVHWLRRQGYVIPTRGQIKDIGKGVSHKRQIVADYLAGHTFSDIKRRQRHSISSIQRYCRDFTRVVRLQDKGFSVAEISRVTRLSERLVAQYQALYTSCDLDNDRLQLLLADTAAIPDTPAQIKRGHWLQ
jgi:hypothetical protein